MIRFLLTVLFSMALVLGWFSFYITERFDRLNEHIDAKSKELDQVFDEIDAKAKRRKEGEA